MERKVMFGIMLGLMLANTLTLTFSTLGVHAQGQVTLNPTDDTYTDWWYDESNYGGQTVLYAMNSATDLSDYYRWTWLKFSLSEIPDGAVIASAVLSLYAFSVTETHNISAHFCSDNSWTELTITNTNEPSFNQTAMDWLLIGSPNRWLDLDTTYAVKKTVDGIWGGTDMVSVVVQDSDEVYGYAKGVAFYSKEFGTNTPKLNVTWSQVVPEFASPIALFLALSVVGAIAVTLKRKTSKTFTH